MRTQSFDIDGPVLFKPKAHKDARGRFMETFRRDIFFNATGCAEAFVQDNCSHSVKPATLRGLHAQTPPKAQGKLVTVTAGAIYDVAVDIRKSSKTYGRHIGVTLSADTGAQFWIPAGFSHGFITLARDTIVTYKCTDYYSKSDEITLAWDDKDLAIDWGHTAPVLSDKDALGQSFAKLASPF